VKVTITIEADRRADVAALPMRAVVDAVAAEIARAGIDPGIVCLYVNGPDGLQGEWGRACNVESPAGLREWLAASPSNQP
jgi:hypothetical protein